MHANQRGEGRDRTFETGERATGIGKECGGPLANEVPITGEIRAFTGGSHQTAIIVDDAGYTHIVKTSTLR